MRELTVLLADSNLIFVNGLSNFLSSVPEVEVVGKAVSTEEALRAIVDLEPFLTLAAWDLPRDGALQLLSRLRQTGSPARVVVLGQGGDDEQLFASVREGAFGFLPRDVSPEELVYLLQGAREGYPLFCADGINRLLRKLCCVLRRADGTCLKSVRITSREREVMRLMVAGLSNKDIAAALCITEHTVKNHVRRILEKLGVSNRVQVAALAVREDMFDADGWDLHRDAGSELPGGPAVGRWS